MKTRLTILLPFALLFLLVAGCGGGGGDSDDSNSSSRDDARATSRAGNNDDEDTADQDESSDDQDDNAKASPTRKATTAPTRKASASPTRKATTSSKLTLRQWAEDACGYFYEFNQTATENTEGIQNADPKGDGAKEEILEYYGRINAALEKYANSLNDLPVATEKGASEVKEIWVGYAQLSVEQFGESIAAIQAIPDGPTFADDYFELTTDYRDDHSDQNLYGDIDDLRAEYSAVDDVIDVINNDPDCDQLGVS